MARSGMRDVILADDGDADDVGRARRRRRPRRPRRPSSPAGRTGAATGAPRWSVTVPDTVEDDLAACEAFGDPTSPVDTHVACRW